MKKIVCLSVILIFAMAGCGKSVLMKYAEPEARTLCEDGFYQRYHALVTNDEKKEMEQIKNIVDCQKFVSSFWEKRDINPLTPENEFKIEMEKRVKFIEEEALFQHPDTPGIRFENNGGFWGDLAKVYMLHGTPDYMEVMQNGRTFVDLMIWVYFDESGQRHKYRFLFYHKNGVASFMLFRPLFDILLGLQEINKTPSFVHPIQVYDEIEQRFGYIFLLSLVYFSDDFSLSVGKALDPPKTASEIIENEAPTIQGELPENKEELAYQSDFKSTVPAELSHELTENGFKVKVTIRHENLDWKVNKGDDLVAEVYARVIARIGSETIFGETTFYAVSTKEKILEKKSSSSFDLEIKTENPKSSPIKYSVYIKNNNKYNAWIEEIER